MRKIHLAGIILSLVFVATLFAQEQSLQQLFREGNQYFQKGEYAKAIESYQKILDQGYESGALYYNMGNAYFKMNQLGKARLFYERAKRFMPDDEALKENLQLLKRRLVDKIAEPPKFFLTVWWESFLGFFSITLLSYLVVAAFWLFLLSWAFFLYMKKQKRKEKGKAFIVVTLFAFLLFGIMLFNKIQQSEHTEYGVIMKPSVTVYSEPRKEATEIFVLHEGTKVQILRRNLNWLEIKLADGKTGWLLKETLEKV